jgi:hypothetical protein
MKMTSENGLKVELCNFVFEAIYEQKIKSKKDKNRIFIGY